MYTRRDPIELDGGIQVFTGPSTDNIKAGFQGDPARQSGFT